jgi:tetratricopeptide (TPR) repeat protein
MVRARGLDPRPETTERALMSQPALTTPRYLLTTALASSLAALALAGCATAPPNPSTAMIPPANAGRSDIDNGASNYGLFLAGEAALQHGQADEASRYFTRAAAGAGDQSPADQALIREKAFEASVIAGDIDKANGLAPLIGAPSTPVQRLARLVKAVDALANGRNKEANDILIAPGGGAAFSGGIILLKPWAAAAAGDNDRAVASPEGPSPRLTRLSALESQALLLERAKRYDEAETDYKSLTANPQLGPLYTHAYGDFLERRGRVKEAIALYTAALAHAPNDRDLKASLARATAGRKPPPLPSLKQGAAKALTAAAELALVDKQIQEGEIYLRLALKLDPGRDEAWVLLGDIRATSDQPAAAREAYAHIGSGSSAWPEARQRIVASYQAQGDNETALKLAQELIKSEPNDRDALIVVADLYRATNRFDDAVKVLDKVIATSASSSDWVLYFERGTALDRAGHWPEAEQDLQKALALQPDEPDVLNYLGYSWVTRGEKLQQAMAMLQKAYLAQPDSGEIADSLGWAYYSLGDYKAAVARLERAVALAPISAEINDHLGDAYWRAGRKTEAQFQWTRVLSLQPSDELKEAAQKKINGGLSPVIAKGGTQS